MLFTALVFLILLSLLVFAHELGHFLLAKKAGIKVEEFGFGLPPRIWGKKIGETIYSINALPIGGFVKLFGEEQPAFAPLSGATAGKGAFWAKSKKVRLAVVVAGVVMNSLLALAAFSLIYFSLGIPAKTEKVKVVGITKDSPAEKSGLKVDDRIIKVAGQAVFSTEEFIKIVNENKGKEIEIVVQREKSTSEESWLPLRPVSSDAGLRSSLPPSEVKVGELKTNVVPRQNPPEGEGPLGVAISQIEQKFYPFYQMPFLAFREGAKETFYWGTAVAGGVVKMVAELARFGRLPRDIAGPVGIFQVTGVVAKEGIWSILQFLGILSVNLAVINILPFPPLDGGKVLFIGAEAIWGRKLAPKIEKWVQNLGMILLLLLLVLVTLQDISRIL
jgi:regulator of sigma E protease